MIEKLEEAFAALKKNEHVTNIRSFLPPLNFITIHYAYFIATCMIFSIIIWGSSHPEKSISYADSLFFAVSAMTEVYMSNSAP
jgi:hypothetical protein